MFFFSSNIGKIFCNLFDFIKTFTTPISILIRFVKLLFCKKKCADIFQSIESWNVDFIFSRFEFINNSFSSLQVGTLGEHSALNFFSLLKKLIFEFFTHSDVTNQHFTMKISVQKIDIASKLFQRSKNLALQNALCIYYDDYPHELSQISQIYRFFFCYILNLVL